MAIGLLIYINCDAIWRKQTSSDASPTSAWWPPRLAGRHIKPRKRPRSWPGP